ncbi:MAG: CpsD/CapB family tyrosine-protein kinase [Bacillaceae bacterium]|nr:CpsD/CapB family tyrosine-protein kinase [Bacillaceae bacterium]
MKRNKRKKSDRFRTLVAFRDERSNASEAYRTLRTNLQFASVDREVKSILVTSSGPAEGKSTTITNLAVVLAQSGKKVLLIDADMRKPTVHHYFRVPNHRGLSNMLAGVNTLEEVITKTGVNNLHVVTSGPVPPNPAEILASKKMSQFVKNVVSDYDYVLIDAPPVVAVTDAQILAGYVDGVVLVIHAGKTNKDMAVKAKHLLENVHARILGTVLNNRKLDHNGYYEYYHYEQES